MKSLLETTLACRKVFSKILSNTPKEALLAIPTGYRNNIWWNIAHVIATQQALMYTLSGVETRVAKELVNKFKKGTVPDGTATDAEIQLVGELLLSSIEKSIEDYEGGLFVNFNEYKTSADVTLKTIDDAIAFNSFHEGLHLGVILSLQKALKIAD